MRRVSARSSSGSRCARRSRERPAQDHFVATGVRSNLIQHVPDVSRNSAHTSVQKYNLVPPVARGPIVRTLRNWRCHETRDFLAGASAFTTAGICSLPLFAQPAQQQLLAPGPLPEKSLGDAGAPVTVSEYASLPCGHCRNFHMTVWLDFKAKYVDTGKTRLKSSANCAIGVISQLNQSILSQRNGPPY